MGTRYELKINCIYCRHKNYAYYAPTSSIDTVRCTNCKKVNFIKSEFKSKKIEELTLQDIKDGFEATTTHNWEENELNEICEFRLKDIKYGRDN